MIFLVERLPVFLVDMLYDFFVVERLRDSVGGEVAWFLCLEVV